MRAVVRERYGSPDVIELREVEKPALVDDGVLVRVRAVSVNPVDWYGLAPPLVTRIPRGGRGPKSPFIGVDFAGTVEAVGKDVTQFQPGDEVYGGRTGAFAEYVCVKNAVAPKPANVSFEEAAAVPVAGLTALQAVRDKARVQPGQKVLINGASGGVGTFAVQVAKAFGAEVTAVCSTANVETARSLGADHVVDYTRDDFTQSGERYDLMLDVAGSRSWSECTRVLVPGATVVAIGARAKNGLLGPLSHIAKMRIASTRGSRRYVFFIAKLNREDLHVLNDLIADGKVKPVIDRRYDLSQIADAFRYLGDGHARGKIVVTV